MRKRTDANQSSIIAALRKIGARVKDTSAVGGGFPDLVAGFRGRNWLLEVKDGDKPPSARKLTPAQVEFEATWPGQLAVVKDAGEAIKVLTRETRDC